MSLQTYQPEAFFDEMYLSDGVPRPNCEELQKRLAALGNGLADKQTSAERALTALGITFRLYAQDQKEAEERILPFDVIPRVISASDWMRIEEGLKQRTAALNLFLNDIYGAQMILKDRVIPSEIVMSSSGYLPIMMGVTPPHGVFTHISGTDLIRDDRGEYMVLEDNLRCPSGVSYVLENREVMKRTFPDIFAELPVRPVADYPLRLRMMLASLSDQPDPLVVVLTPGRYNSAYYEHSFLAQKMGVPLVEGSDLMVTDGYVYMKTTRGRRRVDVIYRRIDDAFLDPEAFRPDSMLGVRGLFASFAAGNVALVNAPGAGVADDKVIYTFVPDMIRYYLKEEPILANVPTWLCSRDVDRAHVLQNLDKLVVKAADGAGGYGMLIGPASTAAEREEFAGRINANPRGYIAQPTLSLSRVPTIVDDADGLNTIEGRHVDLRPFLLYGRDMFVLPGGLTRVALRKGSLVVNSSQGGGAKDTWVLAE